MTQPFILSINSLALPACTQAEAAFVAQSLTSALEELFARDTAAGIVWREELDTVSLEVSKGLSAKETGLTLALHLRDALAIKRGQT